MKLTVDKFKRSAKRLADHTAKPLNEAQELLAQTLGLGNFHSALAALGSMESGSADAKQVEPDFPHKWEGPPNIQLYLRLLQIAGARFGTKDPRIKLLMPVACESLSNVAKEYQHRQSIKAINLGRDPKASIKRFIAVAEKAISWGYLLADFMELRDKDATCHFFNHLKTYIFSEDGLNADPIVESKFVDVWYDPETEAAQKIQGFGSTRPVRKEGDPAPIDRFIPKPAQVEHYRISSVMLKALELSMMEMVEKVEFIGVETESTKDAAIRALLVEDPNTIVDMLCGLRPSANNLSEKENARSLALLRAVVSALCGFRTHLQLDLSPQVLAHYLSLDGLVDLPVRIAEANKANGGWVHADFQQFWEYERRNGGHPSSPKFSENDQQAAMFWQPVMKFLGAEIQARRDVDKAATESETATAG